MYSDQGCFVVCMRPTVMVIKYRAEYKDKLLPEMNNVGIANLHSLLCYQNVNDILSCFHK